MAPPRDTVIDPAENRVAALAAGTDPDHHGEIRLLPCVGIRE